MFVIVLFSVLKIYFIGVWNCVVFFILQDQFALYIDKYINNM